jgi:poly-gamma-glutamate synthesis protein (capsule biosynthesis protein)
MAARAAGAEVLVAYMHWGEEYQREPGSEQQHYGPKLVAAGVDVIIGGHPHMVQPCYWLEGNRTSDGGYQRTLCLSSLGNFLSDQRSQYRDSGIIFDFTIKEVAPGEFEIINPEYIPTYVWRTGSESAGFDYRVMPCGPYLNKRPEGMDGESYNRLVEVWYEIIDHMNTGTAACSVLEK